MQSLKTLEYFIVTHWYMSASDLHGILLFLLPLHVSSTYAAPANAPSSTGDATQGKGQPQEGARPLCFSILCDLTDHVQRSLRIYLYTKVQI